MVRTPVLVRTFANVVHLILTAPMGIAIPSVEMGKQSLPEGKGHVLACEARKQWHLFQTSELKTFASPQAGLSGI